MKKLIQLILLTIISVSAYAQLGSQAVSGVFYRVNDSTAYQSAAATKHTAGYKDIYWNAQATTPHWDIWNGSGYDHIFGFGSGVGVTDGDKGDITVSGSGATWTVDAIAEAALPAKYIKDLATTVTTGGTITLDMNSQIERLFTGGSSFNTDKTLAMSSTTNSLSFVFHFEIHADVVVLTYPSDWLSSDFQFNGTTWTSSEQGKYRLSGTFDGTNWRVSVIGVDF